MISDFRKWFRQRTTPELVRLHDAILSLRNDNDFKREFEHTGMFGLIDLLKGMIRERRNKVHEQARLQIED